MGKLRKNNDGFTMVEVLLVVVTLVIIGVAGYFVAKHVDSKKTVATPAAIKTTTSSTSNISEVNWVSYELKNEKLNLKYPNTWSITYGASQSQPYDSVIFKTTNLSVSIGELGKDICSPSGGGEQVDPIADYSEPITFAGQSGYLTFFHYFDGTPSDNKDQIMLVALSTDQQGQVCFPSKNVIIASKPAALYMYMQYGINGSDDVPISYPLATVLKSQDLQEFKQFVASMNY